MALTEEWRHRIERWQKALWNACYRSLGSIEWAGFTTQEQLTADQALQKYELALSKAPGNDKARKEMNDLRDLFSATGATPAPSPPLTITEVRLESMALKLCSRMPISSSERFSTA